MHTDLLGDIAICIITATGFAFLAKWMRQPLILGYILAGVAVGSTQGFGVISSAEEIETISELGLILLLFMIGLEIDLKKLMGSGPAIIAAGIGQFIICLLLGIPFMQWLGFEFGPGRFAPLYLSVAAALSSTMIVVKLLYDKFELDTLAGRITLGILVFQDVWAILFLAVQPNLQDPSVSVMAASLFKGFVLVASSLVISRFVLPRLFHSIAKLPELMLIGALAWCFTVTMAASKIGLSREMGALVAGISISTFPYNLDVIAKVISLRDFFITLFFVTLGAKIPRPSLDIVTLALAGSAFVVASRFISITPILHWLGNGHRASIIPALNLSQISEFSLVIVALGAGLGHVDERVLSVVVFMLVITSVTSTYAILNNDRLFRGLQPLLRRVGIADAHGPAAEPRAEGRPIVFLGFFRYASSLLHDLLRADPSLLDQVSVVDFNPAVKKELDRRGIHAVYGDISHGDTLHHATIHHARVVLCTIPDSILKGTTNARLLQLLQRMAPSASVVVTAEVFAEAQELYRQGASFVFIPRAMGVDKLREVVLNALSGNFQAEREAAWADLETRAEILP